MPKPDSATETQLQKPITIREVAKLADVSVATVSRVLNGSTRVDPQLAERVQAAVTTLKYRPSRAARVLAGRSSALLGLLVTDMQNPFYMDLVRGVEEVVQRHGYLLIICNTVEDPSKEELYIDVLAAQAVAGAIIVPTQERLPSLELLRARRIPAVIVDRRIKDRSVDTVLIDDVAAAKEAVTHLINNGYRRIGVITGPKAVTNATERILGYRQALQEAGIPLDSALEQRGSLINAEAGESLTHKLLNVDPPIDALLAANNRITVGALRALHTRNKRVPEDVALVSFGEVDWAVPDLMSITTVMQSPYELGSAAANRLLQRMQKPDAPKQEIILQHQLEVRMSSSPRSLLDTSAPGRRNTKTKKQSDGSVVKSTS